MAGGLPRSATCCPPHPRRHGSAIAITLARWKRRGQYCAGDRAHAGTRTRENATIKLPITQSRSRSRSTGPGFQTVRNVICLRRRSGAIRCGDHKTPGYSLSRLRDPRGSIDCGEGSAHRTPARPRSVCAATNRGASKSSSEVIIAAGRAAHLAGARNAAVLAVAILAVGRPALRQRLRQRLRQFRAEQSENLLGRPAVRATLATVPNPCALSSHLGHLQSREWLAVGGVDRAHGPT